MRSRKPCDVKSSGPSRLPSLKIQVTMPKDAVIDNAFISTALTGSTSEPNARNSSTSITTTTISPIQGRCDADRGLEVDRLGGQAADQGLAARGLDVAQLA